ncbi:Complement C1q subcomponent subunit B [Mizuhopecten yessoensis]|uniref:Complement C1q subcomponent subunit B n=1 Tax=Mizuhopecten yessoensis TaxID=6573 RepID=A0A210R4Z9_MIZYE|nr:Complement C1q subcomponent subunit B [Mizuhopecten yessoensis]
MRIMGTPLTHIWKERDVASVAFSVALQNNINVHDHETMVFGHVILDEGSGYKSGDGIYTAPQSGVYVFTWSITAGTHSGGHDVYTNLVVNGTPVGGIDSDSDASNSGSSTGVVVTYVDYGDHIFIRTGSTGSIISSQSAKSTFSGWLLF